MEMDSIKPHKKLDVWNKAIDLTVDIYKVSEKFPKFEDQAYMVQEGLDVRLAKVGRDPSQGQHGGFSDDQGKQNGCGGVTL